MDLELRKQWSVGAFSVSVFVEALNLTDRRNVVYVYPDTGEPDITNEGVHSKEYVEDPSNYGSPRRIRLGLELGF